MKKLLALLSLVALPVLAQTCPDKNLLYWQAFPPGGESDLSARHQQVVLKKKCPAIDTIIQYKAGAGGGLMWSQMNQLPGDGLNVVGINLPHIVFQPIEGTVSYKTEDVVPVFWFHYTPDALVVQESSPYKTIQDFVKAAKAQPAKLSLGGSGLNSANHAAHERLDATFGIKTTYVPFKGTGDMTTSVVGGHVDGAMSYSAFAINNKGKVRALAVAMDKRHPLLPDTPTFKELGIDWVDGAYRGIGVPKSTPPEARKRIAELWLALNNDPEMKELAARSGFELVNVGPGEMDGVHEGQGQALHRRRQASESRRHDQIAGARRSRKVEASSCCALRCSRLGRPARSRARATRTGIVMRKYRIAAIGGDGIGPEVIGAGIEVLEALARRDGGFGFEVEHFPWSSDVLPRARALHPARRPRAAQGVRRDLLRRRRQPGGARSRVAVGIAPADRAGLRPVRQRASRPRAARRAEPAARRQRGGLGHRPRELGRRVRRLRGTRPSRPADRGGDGGRGVHAHGRRAHPSLRIRARAQAPAQAPHARHQVERAALRHGAVGRGVLRGGEGLSGRDASIASWWMRSPPAW